MYPGAGLVQQYVGFAQVFGALWLIYHSLEARSPAMGSVLAGLFESPAFREERKAFVRHAITVLSLRGAEIAELTFFRSPEAFTAFDLPERLEGR